MSVPDFEKAKQHAIYQLEHKLSPVYAYHSRWHTCDEVAGMAERLAALESLDGEGRVLILTGAYYHDIGFTIQQKDHELVGVKYIQQVLPQFGYSPDQIEVVRGIILATRIPQ